MTLRKLLLLALIAITSCAAAPVATPKPTPTPFGIPEAAYRQQISDLAHALLSACYTIKPTKDVNQLFKCADAYVASVQAARKAAPSPTPTPKPHLPIE